MTSAELLLDAFGRVRGVVHAVVADLDVEQLTTRLDAEANSIAWLIWHLTRIQDDHIADVAGLEQVWTAAGWMERFGLPFDASATGYGHTPADVAAVRAGSDLLVGYYDAVHEQTVGYVTGLVDADLDRIVDERWTPSVSLGVRLISVVDDDLEHGGQAAFVRGCILRS